MLPEEFELEFLLLLAAAATAVCVAAGVRKKRRFKTRPMNRQRNVHSIFERLVKYAEVDDVGQFFKYTRMTPQLFNYLLSLIEPHLKKNKSKNPISPKQCLVVTLHYLAEGCSMQEIAWNNYIGKTTAHCIIKETCKILWEVLSPLVLPEPTPDQLKNISSEYLLRWNLPNCIGALDGKHVLIQAPNYSGSTYFSYKKSFSMILMATCDAYYKFTYVDIGAPGSSHDSAVFKESVFGKALINGTLPLPEPEVLPGTDILFPFFLAADAAFPLHKNIMRPFPGSFLDERKNIFNMRLSRARRTIENTFGILTQRWRRLRNPIIGNVETCEEILMATVVLHNFLQKGEEDIPLEERRYSPSGFVDWEDDEGNDHPGKWRLEAATSLKSIGRIGSNNSSKSVHQQREFLADWLISPLGALKYQLDQLYKHCVPDYK